VGIWLKTLHPLQTRDDNIFSCVFLRAENKNMAFLAEIAFEKEDRSKNNCLITAGGVR
jgi:hypothetical protein